MDNQRMLSSQEAVVGGTEGGPGPTGFPPTTAAAAHARHPERFVRDVARPLTPVACLGNPDPVGMKVYCPTGKETFDDETTEEAPPRRDRGEAA